MTKFIVEFEKGVWAAIWKGDPGRTLVEKSAKIFTKKSSAWKAIEAAQKFRPFKNAKVVAKIRQSAVEDRQACDCIHKDHWQEVEAFYCGNCGGSIPPAT